MNLRRSLRRARQQFLRRSHLPHMETLEPRLVMYNVCSDDFNPCTHEALTGEGLALYYDTQSGSPTLLSQEIRNYAGKIFEGVAVPDQSEPFPLDPIYGNGGLGGGIITINHFWNPDADIDAPMEFNQLGPAGGEDDYPNAFGSAQAMWSRALGEYAAGNKDAAYRFLGLVAHFLGDQTIPTHVHGDTHGPDILDYDAFEEWMSVPNVGNTPTPAVASLTSIMGPNGLAKSRALLSQAESDSLRQRNSAGALLPTAGILNPQPAATEINDQLLWIFLNTNQVADFFASDGGGFGAVGSAVNGDANHPSDPDFPHINGWAQASIDKVAADCATEVNLIGQAGCPTTSDRLTGDNDNHGDDVDEVNDNDGDLSLIRKHSFLHGVRTMGSLFKLWEQAISTPIVTVTITRIEEVGFDDDIPFTPIIGMDGPGEPDYYVGIVMGYNRRVRAGIPPGGYLHDRDGNIRNINGQPMAANLTRRDAFLDDDEGGTEDQSEISPNYRFGQSHHYFAGNSYVSGVDIVDFSLVVWENDETIDPFNDPYDSDDPAEINGNSRVLALSVDLATCVSGATNAVNAGGTQHACNTTISKSGTGNDADDVKVNFTITMFVPNRPPVAEAGGPYTVPEGGSVQLSGADSSDPDQAANTLTYDWDLDNNGSYETSGITPNFSAAGLDGPSSRTVGLRVTDSGGLTATDTATINITNVNPDLQNVSVTSVNENGTVTLTGNIIDPGVPDTFMLVVNWGEGSPQTFFFAAGTTNFSVTHRYFDDNPSNTAQDNYSISLSLSDDDGGTDTATVQTTISNVAPLLSGLAATNVNENGTTTLTGTISDPGTLDTFSLQVNWGDPLSPNNVQVITFAAGTTNFTLTHQYLDDNPTGTPTDQYTIGLTITDDDTGSTTSNTSVTATNLPPVITAQDNSASRSEKAKEGELVTVGGSFTDIGTLDTHTVETNWGDGTTSLGTAIAVAGSGTFSSGHTYATGGIFTITSTLRDDDTGTATAVETVFVTGAGIVIVGDKRVLFVVGTNDDDVVSVRQHQSQITVTANFLSEPSRSRTFSAQNVDEIRIFACGGDDRATLAGRISLPALIDGGPGDDKLVASGNQGLAGTVLMGGGGDDVLTGDNGGNILIGGTGEDTLVGLLGDDILHGGYTIYDHNVADDDIVARETALLSILAEWNSSSSLAVRRANITGTGTGASFASRLNGNNFFQLGVTLFDDDEKDMLTGTVGADWFIYYGADFAPDFLAMLGDVKNF